jgi:hypothetical protein
VTVFRSKAKLEYGKQSHEIDISFSHAGSFMKFSTNGEISYNGRVVSTDITPSWLKEMRKSEVTGVFRLNRPSRFLLESN